MVKLRMSNGRITGEALLDSIRVDEIRRAAMTVRASQLAALADAIAAVLPLSSPADLRYAISFAVIRQLGRGSRLCRRRGIRAAAPPPLAVDTRRDDHAAVLAIAASLRELGVSLRELEPALSAAEQAWARDFKARKPELTAPRLLTFPTGYGPRSVRRFPPSERRCRARGSRAAPLDLRINPLKTKREAALAALADDGIRAAPTPYSPVGVRVAGKPALQHHPLFTGGAVEVQDEGSQLLCFLVAPKRGEMVVDFCAGAGGKTLLLGALMRSQGRLYAFDISPRRLANLKPRLARSGLSNVHPVRHACGSTPFILAVTMRLSWLRRAALRDQIRRMTRISADAAQRSPRSAALLDMHTRPSSRNSVKAGQRLSMYWIAFTRSCPRDSLAACSRM